MRKAVKKLYKYWLTYWFDEVKPGVFSVFQRTHRTNNLVESWHKIFNVLCGGANPNFWNFMGITLYNISTIPCSIYLKF